MKFEVITNCGRIIVEASNYVINGGALVFHRTTTVGTELVKAFGPAAWFTVSPLPKGEAESQ